MSIILIKCISILLRLNTYFENTRYICKINLRKKLKKKRKEKYVPNVERIFFSAAFQILIYRRNSNGPAAAIAKQVAILYILL